MFMSYSNLPGTLVYSANLGDCEDPEIYAAQPLWEWEQTEEGQWVTSNALDKPTFYIRPGEWGYKVIVMAELSEKDKLFYELKYTK